MQESTPRDNLLLRCLPACDYARVSAGLEPHELEHGAGCLQAAGLDDGFHFIGSGLVSLVRPTDGDGYTGVAVVGSEGGAGHEAVTGGGCALAGAGGAIALTTVRVWSLDGETMRREFARGGAMQHNLLCFIHALGEQMARTAVCKGHHSIDDRLCRWILLALDRLPGRELPITQAVIGQMLGVRRASVTDSAARLERDGLIERTRGRLQVPDRAALEARACPCYHTIRAGDDELHRRLGEPPLPA